MHLEGHEAGDRGTVAGAKRAQQPCRGDAHRVVGLLIVFADEVDPARCRGARAAQIVFVVTLTAVPDHSRAEALVVYRGLNLVPQGFHIRAGHHDYVFAVEFGADAQGLEHVQELLPAAENQDVAFKFVTPLAFAVFLGNVVEHIRERGHGQCVQDKDSSEGDQEAEEVQRVLAALLGLERITARVQIEVEDFSPSEGPETAEQHQHQE